MKAELKEKFLKIYANLPMAVREEIIVTLDDGKTMSWNSAFFEIENDTSLSDIILEKLEKLQII
ncbi:MAG: hypothetical protein WC386_02775 [Candidatus Paceibacterota bacterium]|jgi:hypothetical protein